MHAVHSFKKVLLEALKIGGDLHLKYFKTDVETIEKESISSVVTLVDTLTEENIIRHIQERFPSHNILSEECGFIDSKSKYTWIVDPLDGTSNYAAGLPWFGVLIALFEESRPIMGGAYLPAVDQLYFAQKGKGAFMNGQAVSVSERKLSDSLIAFSTDHTKDEEYLNKAISLYRFCIRHARNVRSTNSLFDWLCVADGRLGGCINLFNCIWDIAATSLIIEEAGGKICSLEGRPVEFTVSEQGAKQNYGVFCGNKRIFETFLSTL